MSLPFDCCHRLLALGQSPPRCVGGFPCRLCSPSLAAAQLRCRCALMSTARPNMGAAPFDLALRLLTRTPSPQSGAGAAGPVLLRRGPCAILPSQPWLSFLHTSLPFAGVHRRTLPTPRWARRLSTLFLNCYGYLLAQGLDLIRCTGAAAPPRRRSAQPRVCSVPFVLALKATAVACLLALGQPEGPPRCPGTAAPADYAVLPSLPLCPAAGVYTSTARGGCCPFVLAIRLLFPSPRSRALPASLRGDRCPRLCCPSQALAAAPPRCGCALISTAYPRVSAAQFNMRSDC